MPQQSLDRLGLNRRIQPALPLDPFGFDILPSNFVHPIPRFDRSALPYYQRPNLVTHTPSTSSADPTSEPNQYTSGIHRLYVPAFEPFRFSDSPDNPYHTRVPRYLTTPSSLVTDSETFSRNWHNFTPSLPFPEIQLDGPAQLPPFRRIYSYYPKPPPGFGPSNYNPHDTQLYLSGLVAIDPFYPPV